MNSKLFHDMFVLGLPIAEKVLRPIFVYVFLIVSLALHREYGMHSTL